MIRAAQPEDAEAVLQTLCAAFDLNVDAARPIFYADPCYDLSHKRILTLPKVDLVSCLTVVPLMLRIGGIPVATAGIGGVATRPEFQRQGHAAALLEATVPALDTELGFALSLLHPINAPYYQRFGWGTASSAVHWAATPSALPTYDAAIPVRPAQASDWPAIHRLHADLTLADTGACVRDSRRWRLIQLPIPGRETYVCEMAGGVEGYLICERGDNLHIIEIRGKTPEARQAMVGFLARQPNGLIEWLTSETLLSQFGLPYSAKPPEPDAMLRIVNLEAALAAVHAAHYAPVLAEANVTLTIQATDPLHPRNQSPVRLTPFGIVPSDARDHCQIQTDIRTLAQMYLGYALPSEAAASGLLTVDTPETLALADRLFPLRQPFVAPLDQV